MRYIGLIMGIMLLSNQAFAEKYVGSSAEKIITKGEIIHKERKQNYFYMRVIYKSKYYYCQDSYYQGRSSIELECFSVN